MEEQPRHILPPRPIASPTRSRTGTASHIPSCPNTTSIPTANNNITSSTTTTITNHTTHLPRAIITKHTVTSQQRQLPPPPQKLQQQRTLLSTSDTTNNNTDIPYDETITTFLQQSLQSAYLNNSYSYPQLQSTQVRSHSSRLC